MPRWEILLKEGRQVHVDGEKLEVTATNKPQGYFLGDLAIRKEERVVAHFKAGAWEAIGSNPRRRRNVRVSARSGARITADRLHAKQVESPRFHARLHLNPSCCHALANIPSVGGRQDVTDRPRKDSKNPCNEAISVIGHHSAIGLGPVLNTAGLCPYGFESRLRH